MLGARDWEKLNDNTQIVQILCSDSGGRPQGFVVVVRCVIVGDQEQAPRGEIRSFCGENLVRAEQDICHRDRLVRRLKKFVGLILIVDKITQTLDVSGSRNIEVGQEVAMWIRETPGGIGLVLEARLFGTEEKNAHHVIGIGYDALLHQRVGAFQGSNSGSITISFFRVLLGRFGEHGRADIDSKKNSIFDCFVALSNISLCLFTWWRIKVQYSFVNVFFILFVLLTTIVI